MGRPINAIDRAITSGSALLRGSIDISLGIEGLGPLTGKGSGLMVMAIVGGAIIPVAEGALADRIGIHHAFILPALCYVYIAFYGFKGSVELAKPASQLA